jgi:hypothetical protein
MATPRKTARGKRVQRQRNITLGQMHDAAVVIEGVLRKTVEVGPTIEALAKVHPRQWLRVGLQGLIRALDKQEGK